MAHIVYLLSDRTGITVEGLADAVLSQFQALDFERRNLPFIDSPQKMREVADEIAAEVRGGADVLVFSSLTDPQERELLCASGAVVFDLFDVFVKPLERLWGVQASGRAGGAHGIADLHRYDRRLDAVNFALRHDDGVQADQLEKADVLLLGVSRSGKTPTCLYLALNFGLCAANYPLTDEDMRVDHLPSVLEPCRDRLFGLLIQPERLQQIRQSRRPGSRYASPQQCRREVAWAERLYRQEGIPWLDSTHLSVEEMAAAVRSHLARRSRQPIR